MALSQGSKKRISQRLAALLLDLLEFVQMELKHYIKKDDPLYERERRTKFFNYKTSRLKKFLQKYIVHILSDPGKMELVSKIADDEAFAGNDFQLARFTYCSSVKAELFRLLKQKASISEIKRLIDEATLEQNFVLLSLVLFWEHFHGQSLLKEIMFEEGNLGEAFEKQVTKLYKHFLDVLDSGMIKTLDDLERLEKNIMEDVDLLPKLDMDKIRELKQKVA
ncbi:MAG: hypothetical protein ACTSU5_07680 [Promethearchaeota archaeon]